VAVDGFFLISGHLIAMSWLADPSLGRFLWRRSLRILPGFAAAVLVSVAVVGPIGDPGWWSRFRPGPFAAKLAMLSMRGVPDSFPGSHYPAVNAPTWTIRFEFACYLVVAALGRLGLLRRRGAVLAIAAASLAYSLAESPQPIRRFLPLFLAGACF
jgi:peptidoglycan/LPS O-acetylase OafA/YrhL